MGKSLGCRQFRGTSATVGLARGPRNAAVARGCCLSNVAIAVGCSGVRCREPGDRLWFALTSRGRSGACMAQLVQTSNKVIEAQLNGTSIRALTGSMVAYEGNISFKSAGFGGG